MSYRIKSRNRILKRKLTSILNFLRFNGFDLSLSYKFVLVWFMITTFSLFLPWIDSKNIELVWSAFSSILWITGYVIFAILITILFFVIFKDTQEKIKSILNLIIKDWNLIIFLFIFCLILSINSIYFINWLSVFKQSVIIWIWIIWSIIWEIFWIIWWYLLLKEKTKIWIIIEDNSGDYLRHILDKTENQDKNNMKLPF